MPQYPSLPATAAFKLLSDAILRPIIDVRSEGEFHTGHIANTLNIPILCDAHRHQVGLTYKTKGSEAAKILGHQLVGGAYREHLIQQWCDAIKGSSEPALVFCWRGGLRSRITQEWIYQHGFTTQRIEGGYKALRNEALKILSEPPPMIILSGMTGSGKTRLLHTLERCIDLEALAQHRGSAFGGIEGTSQPQQATFENMLAQAFSQVTHTAILEDESPNIGRCHLPDSVYTQMSQAPMVIIESPARERALEIYQEYLQTPFDHGVSLQKLAAGFAQNVQRIHNKLGGLECAHIQHLLSQAFAAETLNETIREQHLDWIERLLTVYYDKQYLYSFTLKARPTLFKGAWEDCLNFIRTIAHE